MTPQSHVDAVTAPTGFAGQTGLVTGAGSGIGRAVAIALAARGMTVVLSGRRQAPLEDTARTIARAGGSAMVETCDLSDDDDRAVLVTTTLGHSHGRLAVVVHSAGRYLMAPVDRTTAEEFDAIFGANIKAPYLLTQALLPGLREARGRVVFLNSSAAMVPGPTISAYAASKAALKTFAQSLRDELNKDGVSVLSVFPGRTATPMQRAVHATEGREYHPGALLQPEEVASAIVCALALPFTAEITDLHIRARTRSAR